MTERRGMSTSTNPADTVWEQDASPAPSQDIPELADYMDRYQLTEEEQHQAAQQIRELTSRVEEAEARLERVSAAYEASKTGNPNDEREQFDNLLTFAAEVRAALDQPPSEEEE